MKTHYQHSYNDLEVIQIPVLKDNYSYVLKVPGAVAIVDPGEALPIEKVLGLLNLVPTHIINTHHHWDHTGGNLALKEKYRCEVWGPQAEASNVPGITKGLIEGPTQISKTPFQILSAPGHTKAHILLYFEKSQVLFTGDVLFCGGCGRVFEGTHQEMYDSLQKIKVLPSETVIFCGHEYSLKNLEFAKSVGTPNIENQRLEWQSQINSGIPTVPSRLKTELSINPFLRAATVEEFSSLRNSKDKF